MANLTRWIGLSLGADICWPICFEEILKRLKLDLPIGGDRVSIECERLSIEPFDLAQDCKYDVVVDRLTHWFDTSREWIKKSVIMNDLYVFNNPWSVQSMEKCTTYCLMLHLGLPVPPTWLVPPKEHLPTDDLQATLSQYAKLFNLEEIGEQIGYPLYMKPYDGGAWVGVSRVDDGAGLLKAYEGSGTRVMHLQRSVEDFDLFVRCVGIGPQLNVIHYDPSSPLHDRYKVAFNVVDSDSWSLLRDMTLTINSIFGWDFNSCECLRREGVFYPIDFANPCPDSQVTSLHYHFPWVVTSQLAWAVYCATTQRKMQINLDWTPFFEIRKRGLPYREQLREYAKIAEQRLEVEAFGEFRRTHLAHLDEVALEFFAGDIARDAVHKKVTAMFPAHEVEEFTEHFWGLIQFWRRTETDRLNRGAEPSE